MSGEGESNMDPPTEMPDFGLSMEIDKTDPRCRVWRDASDTVCCVEVSGGSDSEVAAAYAKWARK